MHWFWWVLIIFVALIIVNRICEDSPGFRHVLCCIIALAYPILTLINYDNEINIVFIVFGPIVLGFYKFVYGVAEIIEEDGAGDILGAFFSVLSGGEVTVVSVIMSVVLSLLFAAAAIFPFFLLLQLWEVLAFIYLFAPAAYCIFGAVRYFSNNY